MGEGGGGRTFRRDECVVDELVLEDWREWVDDMVVAIVLREMGSGMSVENAKGT